MHSAVNAHNEHICRRFIAHSIRETSLRVMLLLLLLMVYRNDISIFMNAIRKDIIPVHAVLSPSVRAG